MDSHWSLFNEARWLGLLPGWPAMYGPTFPREALATYADSFERRVTSFTGTGELTHEERQALLAALREPARALEFLRPVLAPDVVAGLDLAMGLATRATRR